MKIEKLKIEDLGLIEYSKAYAIQKDVLEKRKNEDMPDTLLLAEHPSVFTMGRTGSMENLLVDVEVLDQKDIKLLNIDRGGDITYHGPGQILLYPIINIKKNSLDVHSYIRSLEDIAIQFLSSYGLNGHRIKGSSGVWVDDKKISSIGVGVSKWVSFHGMSININNDLNYFSMIRSCGIKGIQTTSLAKILKQTLDMEESKKQLISIFRQIFKQDETIEKIPTLA